MRTVQPLDARAPFELRCLRSLLSAAWAPNNASTFTPLLTAALSDAFSAVLVVIGSLLSWFWGRERASLAVPPRAGDFTSLFAYSFSMFGRRHRDATNSYEQVSDGSAWSGNRTGAFGDPGAGARAVACLLRIICIMLTNRRRKTSSFEPDRKL